jgi:aspartokinase
LPEDSNRLGGFKVLKGLTGFSVVYEMRGQCSVVSLYRQLSEKKINLPFIVLENQGGSSGLQMVVESADALQTSHALEAISGQINHPSGKKAILSLFPHRNDPHIAGALMQALGKKGIPFNGLAHSQSAISVVLDESVLNRAASALFEPFRFGAYRTPADWKLAQKGKEDLHKEVVATYQEQRPKVYFLEWQNGLTLLQVVFQSSYEGAVGLIFEGLAELGFHLTFLITSPARVEGEARILFCVHQALENDVISLTDRWLPDALTIETPSIALFSMNGPHFGDRYGLVDELITAFDRAGVDLLALSCSIASMAGVVPSGQIQRATDAIRDRFEVPSVIGKEDTRVPRPVGSDSITEGYRPEKIKFFSFQPISNL